MSETMLPIKCMVFFLLLLFVVVFLSETMLPRCLFYLRHTRMPIVRCLHVLDNYLKAGVFSSATMIPNVRCLFSETLIPNARCLFV